MGRKIKLALQSHLLLVGIGLAGLFSATTLWFNMDSHSKQQALAPFVVLLLTFAATFGLASILPVLGRYRAGKSLREGDKHNRLQLQNDRAMREMKAKLKGIYETSDSMIFMLDAFGAWAEVSERGARKIYGMSPSELIGRPFSEVVHPSRVDKALKLFDNLADSEHTRQELFDHDSVHVRKDGSPVYLTLNILAMSDANGRFMGCLGICHDQTQIKEAELLKVERLKKNLKYNKSLLELNQVDQTDLPKFARRLTETAARILEVERVGFWQFQNHAKELVCLDNYELSKNLHISGQVILSNDCPRYFATLRSARCVASADVQQDSRFSELLESYLKPLGIISMMDIGIRLHGHLAGVLCFESVGLRRNWTIEEQDYGSSLADFATLSMESNQIKVMQDEIEKLRAQLVQYESDDSNN